MRSIVISAGHSSKLGAKRDNGAVGNGFVEGVLVAELRNLIVQELKLLGVNPIVDKDDSIFSESIAVFRKLVNSKTINLDLHFNSSSNLTAKGTETFVPAKPTDFEVELAENLSEIVAKTLEISLRGKNGVRTELESHHRKLAWMGLTGENVLMEICFISNKSEMERYQKRKYILAKAIAELLKEVATGSKNYTVVKGDTLSKIAKENNTTIQKLIQINNLSSDEIKIGQKLNV